MQLSVHHHPDGVTTEPGNRVVYDLAADSATFGAATVDGSALVWELGAASTGAILAVDVALDPSTAWLMRADRIDFPPGGVAYRHTHPGPGIRVLLHGSISIESAGTTHTYGPLEPWFESGPEPVYAAVSDTAEAAFARVMLLPAEWAGKRTIRYVDPADADKPKTQAATVFGEQPLETA